MPDINKSAIHCVNPECPRPYPQIWGNRFCSSCGAPLQLLERFVPLQLLGSGGFAQIYTVWDRETETEKVLKVLVEDSPKARELFAQEASVLISLRHRGVPKVDRSGYFHRSWANSGGQKSLPCLVMEKIEGQTLESVKQEYPNGCPPDLVLDWLTQAVEILEHLHQCKIIHRDIKPSNLMLRNPSPFPVVGKYALGAQLVLIDFGGVKQFDNSSSPQPGSTRLFSSGYSPPEQIMGGNVEPAADFYALGRTMIELLTARYPQELEDPVNNKLCWRNLVNINPYLADLLDEMVDPDVRSRPRSAAIIKKRLAKIFQLFLNSGYSSQTQPTTQTQTQSQTQPQSRTNSKNNPNPGVNPGIGVQNPNILVTLPLKYNQLFSEIEQKINTAATKLTTVISQTTIFTFKAIFNFLKACLNTIWSMFFTAMGALFGTIAGFILAYRTIWGLKFAELISVGLPYLTPNPENIKGSQILFFAVVGLGTAWGVTAAGGFGQRKRYFVSSLMGLIAYSLGWIILQMVTPTNHGEGIIGLILVAVSLLTLGLGLRSHHIVYAIFAAFGTAIPFAAFIQFDLFSTTLFQFNAIPQWLELLPALVFFVVVGILLSFFLGITYYLIVPGLRFLGWRS